MNIKNAYTLSIISGIILLTLYFDGIVGFAKTFIALFLYSIIAYIFYWIWKKIRFISAKKYRDFLPDFFYSVGNIVVLLVVFLGSFSYYYNSISPASMPRFTISNGDKTVIFQAMMHIGSEDFYTKIRDDISNKKKQGYVLFYEGVQSGNDGNMKKFDEAIGIKFSPNLYKIYSKLYGVSFQNNEQFLGLVNNFDYNIDISIDDIMKLYAEQPHENKKVPTEVVDMGEQLGEYISSISPRKLKLIVYLNQALLNFLIQTQKLQDIILADFSNKALFDVILHERNKVIVQAILKHPEKKIYITYGLLHFKGVLEGLQALDKNWKIVDIQKLYPICSSSW